MAREFEERNQKATTSVASIVGITIASMMPVALNSISRCADAIGPFGSRTPSEQPPSIVALIKTRASTADRMLDLLCPLRNFAAVPTGRGAICNATTRAAAALQHHSSTLPGYRSP